MSDIDNSRSGMNGRQSLSGDIIAGFIITIVVLLLSVVCILGYNFLTKTIGLETKELFLWLIFMLIAAAISCFFDTIISLASKKSIESRERSMVQEIKGIFLEKTDEFTNFLTEKTDEITNAVTLQQTDFVSGEQDNILDKLMSRCLETGEKIERIRILAQDSHTLSEFFTNHFENTPFECNKIEILLHSQDVNKGHQIIKEWMWLYDAKDIETLRIRKTNEFKQKAFFGMIIKFQQRYHSIGMIGFYEPQEENGGNRLNTFNKRYGVLSKENAILDVLDTYFNRYFNRAEKLKEAFKEKND